MPRTGLRLGIGGLIVTFLLLADPGFTSDDLFPGEVTTRRNPVSRSDAVLAKAKAIYTDNCTQCHGSGGRGDGPMSAMLTPKPADLTNSRLLGRLTDGEIFWIVTQGQNPMPAFDSKLTDEDRWGLVHLLRALSGTKPNTTPSHP